MAATTHIENVARQSLIAKKMAARNIQAEGHGIAATTKSYHVVVMGAAVFAERAISGLGSVVAGVNTIPVAGLIAFGAAVVGVVALATRQVMAAKRGGVTEPWWVKYVKSFFLVILVMFFIRSFLVEPFKIPSESMIPTLQVSDFILVNKFTYGLRLPIVNQKLVQFNDPQRGDVMVFHYPENPSVDYIKRVVALPGDSVEYRNKQLWINGVEQAQQPDGDYNYVETGLNFVHAEKRLETLGGRKHAVLVNPKAPPLWLGSVTKFKGRENCSYGDEMVRCKVPDGHYFMMGDNRDDSRDSRYWGFVPDNQIVGKAFFIWMNFSDLKRIGLSIN